MSFFMYLCARKQDTLFIYIGKTSEKDDRYLCFSREKSCLLYAGMQVELLRDLDIWQDVE